MNSYKLLLENCPIIVIDNEFFVIDNAIPFSFCYDKEREIMIEQHKFHFQKSDILLDFFNGFETKITGVIGTDILNSFSGLTVDIANSKFYFSDQNPKEHKYIPCDNYSSDIYINGKKTNAIIDLVAKATYCAKEFINNEGCSEYKTEETLFGNIEFGIHKAKVQALSQSKEINALIIPDELYSKTKIKAIINPLQYVKHYFSISFKDKIIIFE